MRKRIDAFSKGNFKQENPDIQISHEKIELKIEQGENYEGCISLNSLNHQEIRGVTYSTNTRFEIKNPQFSGEEIIIQFLFHGSDLKEDDVQKGVLLFICNGKEFTIHFDVLILRKLPKFRNQAVKDMQDFIMVAQQSPSDCLKIFQNKEMMKQICFSEKERGYLSLLSNNNSNLLDLEEFLVAVNAKKRNSFHISVQDGAAFQCNQTQQELIQIKKISWGFFELKISADSEYVNFEKYVYTNNDFIGNTCQIPFCLNKETVHAGRNFTNISITDGFTKWSQTIIIENPDSNDKDMIRKEKNSNFIQLTKLYLKYRFHKITAGVWSEESQIIIQQLIRFQDNVVLLKLFQTQIYLIMNRRQDAETILNDIKREIVDKNTAQWGYYLYLTTFLNKDKVYTRMVSRKVGEIYKRNEENSMLFWILLNVDENLAYNKNRKLFQIKDYIRKGCSSPIILLEGWKLLNQDPLLMNQIDPEIFRILNWGIRFENGNPELEKRILILGKHTNEKPLILHKILETIYQKNSSDDCLELICRNLLRNGIQTNKYHKWFQLGIKKQIHLTNLYEAFLLSMGDTDDEPIPDEVLRYFQYQSQISYKVEAKVYAEIYQHRRENTTLYLHCREKLELFILQQLEEGHLTRELGILYPLILDPPNWDHEMARLAAKILFQQQITVLEEDAVAVKIKNPVLDEEQTFPITRSKAVIPDLGEETPMILVRKDGQKVYSTNIRRIQIMDSFKYLNKAIQMAPEQLNYLSMYFNNHNEDYSLYKKDLAYINIAMAKDEFALDWKDTMNQSLLDFYLTTGEVELLDEYLERLDVEKMNQNSRNKVFRLYSERGMFEKAYYLVETYGFEQMETDILNKLCIYMIQKRNFDIDDKLLYLAAYLFQKGYQDQVLLEYLQNDNCCTVELLYQIWKASFLLSISTVQLEEKLISQMLYTNHLVEEHETVFMSYLANQGKKVLITAYLGFVANQYLMQEQKPQPQIFQVWKDFIGKNDEVPDCIRFAILKFMAEDSFTLEDELLGKQLYHQSLMNNQIFKFYKHLPTKVTNEYPINDVTLIEFKGRPDQIYQIHYQILQEKESLSDNYQESKMIQMFPGIYSFRIITFFGETIAYYITYCDDEKKEKLIDKDMIKNAEMIDQTRTGYNQLNQALYHRLTMEQSKPDTLYDNSDFNNQYERIKKMYSHISLWQEELCSKEL